MSNAIRKVIRKVRRIPQPQRPTLPKPAPQQGNSSDAAALEATAEIAPYLEAKAFREVLGGLDLAHKVDQHEQERKRAIQAERLKNLKKARRALKRKNGAKP